MTSPPTTNAEAPIPARAEIVIVGAGVMGLSIAYHLGKLGADGVVILDKSYLAGGASGRNGGGVRQQWSTEANVRLMQQSVALCRTFARELRINVWFRQGGYLFVARTREQLTRLERNHELQNRCGVATRLIDAAQAQRIVPQIDPRGILGAAYNATDGILFPWPFVWGYARGAVRLGARLFTHTAVTGLAPARDGVTVHTPRGAIRARRVVIACGAWSREVAQLAGVTVPTRPVRHEICASEPLKPFLGPMVSDLSTGLYCSQSMRGEIIGGVSLPHDGSTLAMGSRLRFLATYARELARLMPILGHIRVLRQWAGPYDVSDDGDPIVGEAPGVSGVHLCCGFGGHGFMMAPIVGLLYARWLAGEPPHELFARCTLARFAHGARARGEDFVIG